MGKYKKFLVQKARDPISCQCRHVGMLPRDRELRHSTEELGDLLEVQPSYAWTRQHQSCACSWVDTEQPHRLLISNHLPLPQMFGNIIHQQNKESVGIV